MRLFKISLFMGNFFKLVLLMGLAVVIQSCQSKNHKADKIDTSIEKGESLSADTTVGLKDGNMVVQKKVLMNEELRRLQNDVYELEDHVYGNRKYGSQGLYGVLKSCRGDLSDPKNKGDGKLKWTEPIERVTEKEDEFKIGLDEKEKLVGVSEEFLKDRIERFRGYKKVLMQREDEYNDKVSVCKAELKARKGASEEN